MKFNYLKSIVLILAFISICLFTKSQKSNHIKINKDFKKYYSTNLHNYRTVIDKNNVNDTLLQTCVFKISCSTTNVLCKGNATGSMTISTFGGTAPFKYTWTIPSGFQTIGNTANATRLKAGTYSVIVKDARGRTASTSCTISEPATRIFASDEHTDISCFGERNGTITVAYNGGTGPYKLKLDMDSSATITSPAVYSNLTAGNHSWSIKDANGCRILGEETITEPTAISSSSSHTDVLCKDGNTGSVTLTFSGGAPYYAVSFNDSAFESKTSQAVYANLIAGIYNYTIKDANGCTLSGSENISEPSTPCYTECNPLKTFTQGGWGATPAGGNPGVYLHSNFDAAFPRGITLGCTNTISFTSAQAITDWLPSGSTSATIPSGSIVNPTSYSNILVAQLLAATLNSGFDAYDATFATGENHLGSMYYNNSPFTGMTVNQILDEANNAIGGCSSLFSLTDLNSALTNINENYDNGTADNGYLSCTNSTTRRFANRYNSNSVNIKVFPNPVSNETILIIEGNNDEIATITLYDITGRILMSNKMTLTSGVNQYHINVSNFKNQTVIAKVTAGKSISTSKIIIQH